MSSQKQSQTLSKAVSLEHCNFSEFYDELIDKNGKTRPHGAPLMDYLSQLSEEELKNAQDAAELVVKEMGITFTVYGEGSSIDRAWPIDIIPRIIPNKEWQRVEEGLKQRVKALNMFIADLYHDQKIIKDGVFPKALLDKSVNFRKQCVGVSSPNGIWAHICGTKSEPQICAQIPFGGEMPTHCFRKFTDLSRSALGKTPSLMIF